MKYLKTFKPTDFSTTSRLITSVLFILSMSFLYLMLFVGINEKYNLLNTPSLLVLASLFGVSFFIGVDCSFGWGRETKMIKTPIRNTIIFLVCNFVFFALTRYIL